MFFDKRFFCDFCSMNLVVDIGNTLVKYAVFNKRELVVDERSAPEAYVPKIKEFFGRYPQIENAILSTVGNLDQKHYKVLSLFSEVHLLSHRSKMPFKNRYATPHTLGMDRIALAAGAICHNPKGNTLVIDMGTCITYDMVTASGDYLGGAISPGVEMRYRAMHDQTAKLPLLQVEFPSDFIGNTTALSMHSGVVQGILHELEGTIAQYNDRFEHVTVMLTGGNSHVFSKGVKSSVIVLPQLLLRGLNFLLECNT